MRYADLGQFPDLEFDCNDPLHRKIKPGLLVAQTPHGLIQRLGPQVQLAKTPGK